MTEFLLILFFLGLSIGSFIGASAYRLPRKIPLARGRSFCVSCKRILRWFEIVPLLSYIALKGRCSKCGARIPLQDFLIELAGGGILVGTFLAFGPSMRFIESSIFLSLMCLVALIDREHLIIPDSLVASGLGLGIVLVTLEDPTSLPDAILSGAAASALLLCALLGGTWLFKKPAMGMGDVKLAAVLGLLLGLSGFAFALWLAALLALAFCCVRLPLGKLASDPVAFSSSDEGGLRTAHRNTYIPFGSFLAISSSLVMVFRDQFNDIWLAWLTLLQ